MQDLVSRIPVAAASRSGLLVAGEPGTGRETVARAIHGAEERTGRFVGLDCTRAATDLEGELFGTPQGQPLKKPLEIIWEGSRVHQAFGGTLFLRRVSRLPARLQARLARMLRDGESFLVARRSRAAGWEFRRVQPDVRIAASIDGSLQDARVAVGDGQLRSDLYDHLATCQLEIPPLRRRREDIPSLIEHLLNDICRSLKSARKALTDEATTFLTVLPWRGNVRELRALLEVLARRSSNGTIRIDDVLPHIQLEGGFLSASLTATLKEARRQFEHDYIVAMLHHHRGRVPEAAKALGIQRTNLYRKMRALHLASQHGSHQHG